MISDVQQYQQTPYFLHAEPTIANFLTSFTPLNEADQCVLCLCVCDVCL